MGEFDDDEIEPDPYVPKSKERDSTGIIDVEIDTGYTDTMSDDPLTPAPDDSSVSEPYSPGIGLRVPMDARVPADVTLRRC